MATERPVCEQCRFFHPPASRKESGICHLSPSLVAFIDGEPKTVPRPTADVDDVACSEFEGLH
jgi:hypothetical protein